MVWFIGLLMQTQMCGENNVLKDCNICHPCTHVKVSHKNKISLKDGGSLMVVIS